MRVYLDTCCLSRLFDSSDEQRVLDEAQVVRHILGLVAAGAAEWVSSVALEDEILAIQQEARRRSGQELLQGASAFVSLDHSIVKRAAELVALGFRPGDALHVSCAEAGEVDALLTVDDRMLRCGQRLATQLHVRLVNPVDYLQERNP